MLWTVPQNSAKMEKKKAMSRGEVLCQLIGFSCPLVGSMEEGVAGPAINMTKGHQCMAKNKILNSKPPKKPKTSTSVLTSYTVPLREELSASPLGSPATPEQQGLTVGM